MIGNVRTSSEPEVIKIRNIINEIKKAVIGKDDIIVKVLLCIMANGHVLIEDIPGVGKTTLALAFSKALSLYYNRMQFTPDVLPTDITGFSIYNKATGKFDYKPGVALCNLFLADEINRTSSKTQSALLEIMEEGKVTVDGITRELPKPFIVIATQNPIGSIGTQMLPESQLDRFMIKLSMGYPDINSEIDIIKSRHNSNPMDDINSVASAEDIIEIQNSVKNVFVDDKVFVYIAKLIDATRNHPDIKLGVSPRGTIALTAMVKAAAMARGRDYAIPDDVSLVFKDVTEHRILLSSKAKLSGLTPSDVLNDIIENIPVPVIEF